MDRAASELADKLRQAWSARTASTWTDDNPARGQCSATALVANDFLGGSILKTRVGDAWHFYNLIGGLRLDFTASQFADPIAYDDASSSREEAMSDTSPEQYEELRTVIDQLNP